MTQEYLKEAYADQREDLKSQLQQAQAYADQREDLKSQIQQAEDKIEEASDSAMGQMAQGQMGSIQEGMRPGASSPYADLEASPYWGGVGLPDEGLDLATPPDSAKSSENTQQMGSLQEGMHSGAPSSGDPGASPYGDFEVLPSEEGQPDNSDDWDLFE